MAESTHRDSRRPDETFRLQAIPAHLDKAGVHDLLRQRLGDNVKARVHSLACSPESPREKTATLQFLELPELLLRDGESDKDEWALNLPDELEGPVLDNHFRGMKPLHSSDDSKCTVEYAGLNPYFLFALSGLGSHAFGSFKKRNEPYMWLRDSLSRDLPHLRIFTFGYESRLVESQSFQNINDLAIKFRNALSEVQSVDASRPCILLGHSLGGIVLKQAILQISDCNHLGATRLEAVLGILLFGVPNQGMDVKSLVPMVGDQPNRYLVESLGQSSEILRHQERTFQKVFDFKESMVFSFFETVKSPTAQKVDGRWRIPWETGDFYIYPVDRTHSEMVKFTNSQDEYYKVVKGRLNRLVMNRNEMVRRKNSELRQPKGGQESGEPAPLLVNS
ncbi:hypothetical protein SLS54_004940 [Diplodia seriata]